MPRKSPSSAPKFSQGDEIALTGTVSIVHDEEYGRRRVTVRLRGYDIPVTIWDEYVELVAKPERPEKPSRRKEPLFDARD